MVTDDDDGEGQRRGVDDLGHGLLHVRDDAVGQHEQHEVLLVVLRHVRVPRNLRRRVDELREVRRPVQLEVRNGLPVCQAASTVSTEQADSGRPRKAAGWALTEVRNLLDAAARSVRRAVQRKAVRDLPIREAGAEPWKASAVGVSSAARRGQTRASGRAHRSSGRGRRGRRQRRWSRRSRWPARTHSLRAERCGAACRAAMRSEHPELAGPAKRCLGALATVSWPWAPACGSLEPSRRGGENAQKTRKTGNKWARYGLKGVEESGSPEQLAEGEGVGAARRERAPILRRQRLCAPRQNRLALWCLTATPIINRHGPTQQVATSKDF